MSNGFPNRIKANRVRLESGTIVEDALTELQSSAVTKSALGNVELLAAPHEIYVTLTDNLSAGDTLQINQVSAEAGTDFDIGATPADTIQSIAYHYGGRQASGYFDFTSAQVGDTFTANGVTVTIVASGMSGAQINWDADPEMVAGRASVKLIELAMSDPLLQGYTYAPYYPNYERCVVEANAVGAAGNAYTLAATGGITVSAATLENGSDAATGGTPDLSDWTIGYNEGAMFISANTAGSTNTVDAGSFETSSTAFSVMKSGVTVSGEAAQSVAIDNGLDGNLTVQGQIDGGVTVTGVTATTLQAALQELADRVAALEP